MSAGSAVAGPQSVLEVLRGGGLRAVYQPIVELLSQDVVGYESLARGPVGSAFERPIPMFDAARAENLLGELDRSCREVAIYNAIAAGAGPEVQLFINVEPGGLDDDGVLGRMEEGQLGQLSIVVELTERALTFNPSKVLHAVRWLREHGCRIALDDVGPDPCSLALMPFVAPDVIKLDATVLRDETPALDVAAVVNAVHAESERSGAVILAEGIETPEHAMRAESIGATLGQGWLFGGPGPLTRRPLVDLAIDLPRAEPAPTTLETPFRLIDDARRLRRGDKRLLTSLSRRLEEEALALNREAVVLVSFQDRRHFTPATRRLYQRLSESAALVGALGVDIESTPVDGVRCVDLSPDDPLCAEWNLIVVSPHYAVAFVAKDLNDDGPDADRRFDYFITYDRALVTEAARSLLRRMIRRI